MELVGSPPRVRARLERRLAGSESLAVLRRWIRAHVVAARDTVDDAQLVCTELASNAIDHARGAHVVRIVVTDRELTVEVDDGDPDSVLTLGRSRLGDTRGRGLLVVDALCRWGVRRSPSGKTVWAVIPLPLHTP